MKGGAFENGLFLVLSPAVAQGNRIWIILVLHVTAATGDPAGSPLISTISKTPAEVDAITAFVGGIPADLGAPLQSQ